MPEIVINIFNNVYFSQTISLIIIRNENAIGIKNINEPAILTKSKFLNIKFSIIGKDLTPNFNSKLFFV